MPIPPTPKPGKTGTNYAAIAFLVIGLVLLCGLIGFVEHLSS